MNPVAFYLLAAGTLIGLHTSWYNERRLQRQIHDLRRRVRHLESVERGAERTSNRGIACGYVPLDRDGKISRRFLP